MTAKKVNTITRTFNAPPEKIWDAWANPTLFAQWYGAKGYTAGATIDFRVGGSYLNYAEDPNGNRIYGTGVYKEIIPLKKIVFTDNFADAEGNKVPAAYYGLGDQPMTEGEVTVLFEDEGDTTKLTLHADVGLADAQQEELTVWNDSFDKLAKLVTEG